MRTVVEFVFFFLSFCLLLFLVLLVFSLTNTNDSQNIRDGRGNRCFSCFPLPPSHEQSLISSRFLPLLFNQSICNYKTYSWWDFFSLEIYILFPFLLMQLSRSYWLLHFKVTLWGFDLISNYHPCITKRLSKCIRNEGRFIFLKEIGRRITKSIFTVLNYEMIFLFYINIKRLFQMGIDYTRC